MLSAVTLKKLAANGTNSNDDVYNTVCDINSGDTAWVSISFVLVLGMMPALAFFEAGLLRSKNTLSIITQIFSGVAVLSTMWNFFGYSLTFGPDHGGIIGDFSNGALIGVSLTDCSPHAPTIPATVFAYFQMMFACITPLLMTGSFAERLKFRAFMCLIVLWEILIYYPVAHWIWGGGWLGDLGVVDFAGGIVIHTTAGASCLVAALMLGRRSGFDQYHGEFPPSNVPLAALGAALLWMGWFGFNAGSALKAGPLSTSAIASTQIGSSISGCVWFFLAWYRNKPSTVAILNGVIAGLAGITPAAGFIDSQSTLVVGFILGVSSYYSVHFIKEKLRIDDALDVSSVHGLTGLIGALSTGFCADSSVDDIVPDGLVHGGSPRLLGVQLAGCLVSGAYAGLLTFIIMKFIDKFCGGLTISEEEEHHGLDHTEHAEKAYDHHLDEEKIISETSSLLQRNLSALSIEDLRSLSNNASQNYLTREKSGSINVGGGGGGSSGGSGSGSGNGKSSAWVLGTSPSSSSSSRNQQQQQQQYLSRSVNSRGSNFFFEKTNLDQSNY